MLAQEGTDEKVTPCIVLVDKPKGITSFDVIRRLRVKLGVRKMGHAGTLDPLATGLMIVGVGECTKKLSDLVGLPKTYEAEILLGERTTTGDMEGEVTQSKKISRVDIDKVKSVFAGMEGEILLPVPVYSAIKKAGKPLYRYARAGEAVDVPTKRMMIYKLELLDSFPVGDNYVLFVRMEVGSGTYVRSIAEEIGRRLGIPATVKELRRVKIGDFDVEDAEKLDGASV